MLVINIIAFILSIISFMGQIMYSWIAKNPITVEFSRLVTLVPVAMGVVCSGVYLYSEFQLEKKNRIKNYIFLGLSAALLIYAIVYSATNEIPLNYIPAIFLGILLAMALFSLFIEEKLYGKKKKEKKSEEEKTEKQAEKVNPVSKIRIEKDSTRVYKPISNANVVKKKEDKQD